MLTGILLFIIMLWPSALFHSIAFKKKISNNSIIISLITGQIILAAVLLITSLIKLFTPLAIIIFTGIITIILAQLTKNISIEHTLSLKKTDILFVLIYIIYLIVMMHVSSPYSPDGINQYITWGKGLAETKGAISAHESGDVTYMYSPPLAFGHYAYAFSILGYKLTIPPYISIFFSVAMLLLLLIKARETKIAYAPLLTFLMIISSFFFAKLAKMTLTEPAILFFATASLIYFMHYIKHKDNFSLIIALAASGIFSAIKFTGLLFSAVIFITALIMTTRKKWFHLIFIAIVCNLPLIALLLRNSILYLNPVFPWFANIFPGVYNYQFAQLYDPRITTQPVKFFSFLVMTIIGFPAIILTITHFIRKRKEQAIQIIAATYIISIIIVTIEHWPRILPRYQMQFYGFFALLAGIELAELIKKIKIKETKKEKILIIMLILGLVLTPTAFYLQDKGLYYHDLLADRYGIQEQKNVEKALSIIKKQQDTTPITITGNSEALLKWYDAHYIKNIDESFDYIYQDKTIVELHGETLVLEQIKQGEQTFATLAQIKKFNKMYEDEDIIIWRKT